MARTIWVVFALLVTVFLKESGASDDVIPRDPRDEKYTKMLRNQLERHNIYPDVRLLFSVSFRETSGGAIIYNIMYQDSKKFVCTATFPIKWFGKHEDQRFIHDCKALDIARVVPVDPRNRDLRLLLKYVLRENNNKEQVRRVLSATVFRDMPVMHIEVQYSTHTPDEYCKLTFKGITLEHVCEIAPVYDDGEHTANAIIGNGSPTICISKQISRK